MEIINNILTPIFAIILGLGIGILFAVIILFIYFCIRDVKK